MIRTAVVGLILVSGIGLVASEQSEATKPIEAASTNVVNVDTKSKEEVVLDAKTANELIEQYNARIERHLKAIQASEAKIRGGSTSSLERLKAEAQSFDRLLEVIADLRQFGTSLLNSRGQIDVDIDAGVDVYQKAARAHLSHSEILRQRAELHSDDEFFRNQYVTMADQAAAYATFLQTRGTALSSSRKSVADSLVFVEKSLVVLDDLEDLIKTAPRSTEPAKVAAFAEQLATYIKLFRKTMDAFDSLGNAILDSPTTAKS